MKDNFFADQILDWFKQHGRHDLPWQHPPTPYRVWVSEIMLQQTQVKTVIPFYIKFINKFPTVNTLACAKIDDVLHLWTGLGYYARARHLHQSAQIIMDKYKGQFPEKLEQLILLPGIGRSTAGAICALAYHQSTPILDGNVKRILCRYHRVNHWSGIKSVENELWLKAEKHMPTHHAQNYTQAIMDLGATVCTRKQPRCKACPLHTRCEAHLHNEVAIYPHPKPRKTPPIKTIQFLALINQSNECLLMKRPEKGIWGGLWSFIECEANEEAISYLSKKWKLNACLIKQFTVQRHTFTHYHLDYTLLVLSVLNYENQLADINHEWYKLDHLPLIGTPSIVSHAWKKLNTIIKEGVT